MLRYSGFARISSRVRASGACSRIEVVPRLLGVEHGRAELAPGLHPGGDEGLVGDAPLGVPDAFEPERVGQTAGRVDGEHEHLAAETRRGHGGGGGRRRGLAHAAGAAGHDDLLGGQQAVERSAALAWRRRGRARPSGTQLLAERDAPPGGWCAARAAG